MCSDNHIPCDASPVLFGPCQTLPSSTQGRADDCPPTVSVVSPTPSFVLRMRTPLGLSPPEPPGTVDAVVADRPPLPAEAAFHI